MSMKSLYNWFTSKPPQQFTLGEAINGEGFATYELSKGARTVERVLTGIGLIAAVATLATTPFGLAALTTAIGYAVTGKAAGLLGATFAKVATEGVEIIRPEPALVPIRSQHDQYRR